MTANYPIVIDDAVPYAEEIFGQIGQIKLMPGKEIDAKAVKNAKALIIRSRTQINEHLLKDSSVEFVGSTVVGLDHVDLSYLKQAGIHFYSAQGCNANSVAEFVINALFEAAEHYDFHLTEKTLGIIGVGNVGSRLFQKAEKLGIKCLVNDPPKQQLEPDAYQYQNLDKVLQADMISVHTPLTFGGEFPTYHLIDKEKLSRLNNQQILINAARGGIIDESVWAKTPTLCNIIDCWENEPNIDETLYQTAFLATPHIAGHSFEAKLAGSSMVYQALCDYLQQPVNNQWQQNIPKPKQPYRFSENNQNTLISLQKQLLEIFRHCHNIRLDHQSISAENHLETQKKYEFFRRNYPIYHEWHQHSFYKTSNQELNNLLKTIGFMEYSSKS